MSWIFHCVTQSSVLPPSPTYVHQDLSLLTCPPGWVRRPHHFVHRKSSPVLPSPISEAGKEKKPSSIFLARNGSLVPVLYQYPSMGCLLPAPQTLHVGVLSHFLLIRRWLFLESLLLCFSVLTCSFSRFSWLIIFWSNSLVFHLSFYTVFYETPPSL